MIFQTIRRFAGPAFAAFVFCMALRLLYNEAKTVQWDDFRTGLLAVPPLYIGFAAILVAMNYTLLITYDLLALRYMCRSLPLRRIALVSFLGFSLGNNLGAILAGTPIRFRFYSRFGLSPSQIVPLIFMLGLTFWGGYFFIGGTIMVSFPIELPENLPIPIGTRTLGAVLLTIAVSYLMVCVLWRKPWPVGKLRLRPPEPGLMAVQSSVAAVDLLISATALYLVLPADVEIPFATVLTAYLVGIAVSLLTQVPGGLGVLEVILKKLLEDTVADGPLLASLLMFRLLYYVFPLLFGMVVLVAHEIYGGTVEARQASRA